MKNKTASGVAEGRSSGLKSFKRHAEQDNAMSRINFSNQEVRLVLGKSAITFPDGYRSKVEKHWARINDNGQFFNGPVLAASSVTTDGSGPVVELSLTDYAHYLYAAQDLSHEFDCRAVFCAAAIVTSDNHLLFGEMAGHTSAPGQIQLPGGGVEMGTDGELDARTCCQREVAEELGREFLREGARFRPVSLKYGGNLSTVGIFYALSLDMTTEQAQDSFARYQSEQLAAGALPEFDRLHAVKFDLKALNQFFRLNKDRIVDYLAPLLEAGWDEASAALLSFKAETTSPDTWSGSHVLEPR
ncbi:NUDIX hydrolase [Neorhizobium galegae]|uniref:NUDIX hydrolase n=1 Tax=Neorhizobium galegae TaxID=399 RepID=UPI0013532EA5|nr:NUDIX hydrolase [Neorhizobium galegae]KAB1115057.1 NUDIX hydrolase [Neorhizobium galegae]MCQ1774394.1 NUDIX hydrolase [Neorhizobium galegae]MCQ1798948.1 NUDIX hydrolase [Neorhizobium galegae]